MNSKGTQKITEILINVFFDNLDFIKSLLKEKELIEDKGDGDFVYKFDLEIERLIYDTLRKRIGEIRVLGEEKSYGLDQSKGFLFVDPIDGSTNAKKGLPIYGTLISFFTSSSLQDLVSGIVWDIPRERVFFATKGEGAYLRDHTSTERIWIEKSEEVLSKYELLYDITPHSPLEAILKLGKYGKFRHLGSLGMSICFVCEGGLDLSIDLSGRGRMVDVLAPLLILEECGGHYILEPQTPVKPETRVVYIAGRKKKLVEEIFSEIWKFKQI